MDGCSIIFVRHVEKAVTQGKSIPELMLVDVACFDVALHHDGLYDSVRSEADKRNENDDHSTMDIFYWDLVLLVRINASPLFLPLPVLAEVMIGKSLAL